MALVRVAADWHCARGARWPRAGPQSGLGGGYDQSGARHRPTGTALGATILTVLATPALSLLVLSLPRSRRPVDAVRGRASGCPGREHRPAAAPVPRAAPGPLSTLSPVATAVTRLRQAVGWYLAAGLTYALFTTVLLLSLNGQELLPLRTALVTVVFAWPLVPTLALVCA